MELGNIPPELEEFLQKENYALLIKGLPGTGKTTLALEIINKMASSRNVAYFSSRVSKKRLFSQFPWLAEKIKSEFVVSISQVKIEDVRLSSIQSLIRHLGAVLKEMTSPGGGGS